ncbi:aminopeptidase [Enterococcus devriesei]|uniref:aminopeptidase n=1 Tax=Enterococcus devriesei TaxID=319970 RepID=UPI001C0FE5AA|nr:aminopeptidase [Enterococcus devriesei]MBU5366532.1 aminopeptidase [Enterococcus devriesei]MDT2821084.1 aminopeptidase [Enterococcus devriesei]
MNIEFLRNLSNADGIASNEKEVRQAILTELEELPYEKRTDGLGSLIFTKPGKSPKSIMICGHMDEVGFMVRSISSLGLIHLMVVGGVKPIAQHLQKIRITTFDGRKISGVVNGEYHDGVTKNLYCDIGATTAEEVAELGIEVGNMACYATEFEKFDTRDIYAGKALDDRLACFVMGELMKTLAQEELPLTIHFANTSSEEVGIRGAKTAVQLINPDIVFVIDVATFSSEFVRDHTNQRQIGKGPILTHFDRTLAPNLEMIHYVKETAKQQNIPLQLDMFNSGGTDGGEAHKVNEGKPTVVTILPVRYGHCAYSIVNQQDIQQMIELFLGLIKNFTEDTYHRMVDFI